MLSIHLILDLPCSTRSAAWSNFFFLQCPPATGIGDHHGQPLMILLGISNNVVTFHNLPHRSTGAIPLNQLCLPVSEPKPCRLLPSSALGQYQRSCCPPLTHNPEKKAHHKIRTPFLDQDKTCLTGYPECTMFATPEYFEAKTIIIHRPVWNKN